MTERPHSYDWKPNGNADPIIRAEFGPVCRKCGHEAFYHGGECIGNVGWDDEDKDCGCPVAPPPRTEHGKTRWPS